MTAAPVRILIADDHPVYREGVARVLAQRPEFEVVGEVDDGRAAVDEIRRLEPDVAVLDLRLPGLDGVSAAAVLEREGSPTKVVILSAFEDSATVYRAIASGARAYLQKVVSGETLCRTIVAVARGETVIPPALQGPLASEIRARRERADDPLLTKRELEILRLAADGLSAPEIADRLFVSVTTVKTHLQHVYAKLEVSDRTAAVAQALRRGLLT
ncbi:response regulator [Capillimicrobium parvum]|uniref:Transcriptional regulatory protein NarL n=1 Tax=Capillimicrobium parvum TaxID=2884022 RepID=A0A9E6XWX4_9ACTN|nr:response regulator transcription factor [Capillimicrobium parvum]UGS35928.1 putative transcriptional regulatory protein NarL [Capillimicrobium parvum]